MKEIVLLRHGDTGASSPGMFVGRTDLPLTDIGKLQIENLSRQLSYWSFDRLISSPLSRCAESAAILALSLNLEIEFADDLLEIDLGSWDGLARQEVISRYPREYEARGRDMAQFRIPNGESFTDLQQRVWNRFVSIAESDANRPLLVTHAGVIRVILCRILGVELNNLFRLQIDYGSITLLRYNDDMFTLHGLNIRNL